ncbi:Peroxide-responsive repressor PerR [subsurface metagenome]
MRLIEREVVTVLRRHGYKLTPQRRTVIRTIVATQNHLTPIAIYEKVHQDYPNIGLVTIYRTLEILVKLGLICEVHAGGSCGSYLLKRPSEHHHHLICSECGAVVDFTGCNLSQLEQRLSLETGFEVADHLLEFIGLCQACQKEAT